MQLTIHFPDRFHSRFSHRTRRLDYAYGDEDFYNGYSVISFPDTPLTSGESRRRNIVKRAVRLGRLTTPWQFIQSLEDEAKEHLIKNSDDIPSYIPSDYIVDNLDLAFHRSVTSWNVQEKLVVDKVGKEEGREFVAATFIVSLRWKGKLHSDKTVTFDWREGKFDELSFSEKDHLAELLREESIPEDAGYKEEADLD